MGRFISSVYPNKLLSNPKTSLLFNAIAAGLYPLLFYLSNNYFQINSWRQFGFLVAIFILLPIVLFYVVACILLRWKFKPAHNRVSTFLNLSCFLFLLYVSFTAGLDVVVALLVLPVSAVLAFLLHKQLNKIIKIQFILAIVASFFLMLSIIKDVRYSMEWKSQPDAIESAIFVKKPNVYFIQPDGYPGFSELAAGYYNLESNNLQSFLEASGFKIYNNFRSNYASTLTSNSATFAMKHHYYNYDVNFGETLDAAEVIIEKNPVLSLFKQNGYKTFFLAEKPYLLVHGGSIGYDHNNFEDINLSVIRDGLKADKAILPQLEADMRATEAPSFFFIELFKPWHIAVTKSKSKGVLGEKEAWLQRLEEANIELKQLINTIKVKDPTALIVIMADHGGYVGMAYMNKLFERTDDPDKLRSIFGSLLAIHWPDERIPSYDSSLKTSVNLFRILITYLTENESYLIHLQEDGSYAPIKKGAKKGIYCYIDPHGKIIFKKREKE